MFVVSGTVSQAADKLSAKSSKLPKERERSKVKGKTKERRKLFSETFYRLRFTFYEPLGGLKVRFEARRGLVKYGCSGAGEGFVVCVVEGIDAELD